MARNLLQALVTAGAVALTAVPAAHASSVTVRPEGNKVGIVVYEAAAGEANDVTLSYDQPAGTVTITDAGAVIAAADPCTAVDANTVRCPQPAVPIVRMALGDGNDRLVAVPGRGGNGDPTDNNLVELVADAGPGDDLLDARGALQSRLDGGGGTDRLLGTAYIDVLTDGDAPGDVGPDVLDGGRGTDYVSYAARTAAVDVDLADDGPDGEAGEGDTLVGVDGVTGGAGDDHLAGDRGYNVLDGGPGTDVLIGRGGADALGFNLGHWSALGGAAGFTVRDAEPPARIPAYGDTVRCGRGEDVVWGRRAADFMPASCESVVERRRLPFADEPAFSHDALLPARPQRGAAGWTYAFVCSNEEDWETPRWFRVRCRLRVELREAGGRERLIARGTTPRDRGTLTAALRFTRAGRRLVARDGGVTARLRVRGKHVPHAAWTIRLGAER